MLSAQYFKDAASMLLKSYQHALAGDASGDDVRRWLCLGREALYSANIFIRSPDLTVSDKQKLLAAVGMIKCVLHLLRDYEINSVDPEAAKSVETEIVGKGIVSDESSAEVVVQGGDIAADAIVAESRADTPSVSWDDLDGAFESRIKSGVITNRKNLDLSNFMSDAKRQFLEQVSQTLAKETALKVNAVLAAEYVIVKDDAETVDIKYFNTKSSPIFSTTDLDEWFASNVERPIDADMEDFQEKESGWSLRCILNLIINFNKFNPMRGSSFIELPDFIKKKKACVNVVNDDFLCFKWALLSALHPTNKNAFRVSTYMKYKDELNFEGIKFPVGPEQVRKFEHQNDVSINVYFLKKKGNVYTVLPRHLTAEKKQKHVNLLLVENNYVDENEEEEERRQVDEFDFVHKFHYVWIKNLSRLITNQLSSHNGKTYICDRCLHYFWSNEKLTAHTIDCEQMNKCKIVLPSVKDSLLQFKNHAFQTRVPVAVYADFECLLQPLDDEEKRAYQQHKPFSIGFFVKRSYNDNYSKYKSYRQEGEMDETPSKWFVKNLYALATELHELYKNPRPMRDLTFQEKADFIDAQQCHICKQPFSQTDKKVRDHCHLTGE